MKIEEMVREDLMQLLFSKPEETGKQEGGAAMMDRSEGRS